MSRGVLSESAIMLDYLHSDQVYHTTDHAPHLRRILVDNGLMHFQDTQGTHRALHGCFFFDQTTSLRDVQ